MRLANGLAARGRHATLLLHPEPAGSARLDVELHPGVEILRPPMPNFEESPGDLSPFIPHYLRAVRALAAQSGTPVALAPQSHADGFGVAAALCLTEPESIRLLAWQHSDIEYDARILARYDPVICRFIAVSNHIEATQRARLPHRAADIVNIPCGVELPDPRATDEPSFCASGVCATGVLATGQPASVWPVPTSRNTPLRLIYTGRINHQKRILALAHLSDELTRRGIEHQITAVGDGPALPEFLAAIASRPRIRHLPPQPPRRIAQLLSEHDAFILPSRYEGLSVSMLEAMAAGCTPIVAHTSSGARQVIEPGYNGQIADIAPDADEPDTARALADAVQRFASRDAAARAAMSAAARQTVADRFALDRHIQSVATLIDAAAASPPRHWPADRACAFTTQDSGLRNQDSGSVPPDGPSRLRALLQSLAGRSIIIHGTGQHTLQLGAVFASSPARILAFTDDDRQRHGQKLWNWPILAPADAAKTGATDVVISSWMYQETIWARRGVYESQGLRAHRIYSHP